MWLIEGTAGDTVDEVRQQERLYARLREELTREIVRLDTELNGRVYTVFDLTPAEVRMVEESTKYRYGEV